MSEGPSQPGPTVSAGAGDGQGRPGRPALEQVTQPQVDSQAGPSAHSPTEVVSSYAPTAPAPVVQPHEPTEVAQPHQPTTGFAPDIASRQPGSDVLRYGPGVPPSQAGVSAEQVWRTGQMPEPPPRRPIRLRRLAGTALTVILLAAAGVLLFLRFHHGTFQVTGVKIVSQATNGCAVNVTGQIGTNGAPGTVSYEWVFTPQQGRRSR